MKTKIVYDENKRQANIAKHGMDFADLTPDFFVTATIINAKHGRYAAIGHLADGTITTIFATLGREAIAIISMRTASKKERMIHENGV